MVKYENKLDFYEIDLSGNSKIMIIETDCFHVK